MTRLHELLTIELGVTADGQHLLSLAGELDLSNASSVLARVIDCDIESGQALVLDMSGVTFVDSSGLIALLHAEHYLSGRSCDFALRAPTSQVRRVLELAGLADSFRIVSSAAGEPTGANGHEGGPHVRAHADSRNNTPVGRVGGVSAAAPDR